MIDRILMVTGVLLFTAAVVLCIALSTLHVPLSAGPW